MPNEFTILPIETLKSSVKFRFEGQWWFFSTITDEPLKAYYFLSRSGGHAASYRNFKNGEFVGVFSQSKAKQFSFDD